MVTTAIIRRATPTGPASLAGAGGTGEGRGAEPGFFFIGGDILAALFKLLLSSSPRQKQAKFSRLSGVSSA